MDTHSLGVFLTALVVAVICAVVGILTSTLALLYVSIFLLSFAIGWYLGRTGRDR